MTGAGRHLRVERGSPLQQIGDALDVGVLSVDRALIVTGWNGWLATATGQPSSQVLGRPLMEVQPGLSASARDAFEQAVTGATMILSQPLHKFLVEAEPPPGCGGIARMQQSVRILPLYASDGAVAGAVAFVQDVTERVAREDELRTAMESAQAADRAKSNFLAAMSHELRTPIGAMSAYADLLHDGIFGPVSEAQREHLARIKAVGSHLLGVVEEILHFARIEAGREELTTADADAVQLLRDALLVVEPLASKRGLDLHCELPGAPIAMHTDPVKVRQILINLLGNAVKFTDRGRVAARISTSADDATVTFEVADTGPGIAEEDLRRIFDPLVQVSSSTTRTHEGTGLGLSVSRELAQLLGGALHVTSTLGAGSIFVVRLPGLQQRIPTSAAERILVRRADSGG